MNTYIYMYYALRSLRCSVMLVSLYARSFLFGRRTNQNIRLWLGTAFSRGIERIKYVVDMIFLILRRKTLEDATTSFIVGFRTIENVFLLRSQFFSVSLYSFYFLFFFYVFLFLLDCGKSFSHIPFGVLGDSSLKP